MLHPLRWQTSYRCSTIHRCEASCRLAHFTLRFWLNYSRDCRANGSTAVPIRCSFSPLLERTLRQNNNTFLRQTGMRTSLTLQLHCRQSGGLGGEGTFLSYPDRRSFLLFHPLRILFSGPTSCVMFTHTNLHLGFFFLETSRSLQLKSAPAG